MTRDFWAVFEKKIFNAKSAKSLRARTQGNMADAVNAAVRGAMPG